MSHVIELMVMEAGPKYIMRVLDERNHVAVVEFYRYSITATRE